MRIGGFYALERIARDSAKDHPTVMEVLTAFIREHSREQWPPPDSDSSEQERLTRPDVQAAVTVVGRRDAGHDREYALFIDLTGAELTRANLNGAHLTGANLDGANLGRANLGGAHLRGARLCVTDLGRANLNGADLNGAHLTHARLGGAHPGETDANLTNANLTDVRWPTTGPVPDGWMIDSESGRLKHAGRLSEVTAHYL